MINKISHYIPGKSTRIFQVLLALIFLTNLGFAQSFRTDKIVYYGQDLRQLADKYFDNADLWETILQYNNLNSPVDLKEGMELIIPTQLVNSTNSRIDETKKTIDMSTANGAKVFTPALLSSATDKLNSAIEFVDEGNWTNANRTASEALNIAKQSLEQSQILRNQSADATLSFVKGDVQRKKPSQRLWNDADLYEKLFEADRARTLTESFAEITFIDLSRVRLNENSQALIQRSRVDLLSKNTETTVRLIKGDAFAYLLKSPKKKFDIDVPGLDTKIRSKSFWIEKQNDTKIANYEGEIELEARGTRVVVKENQGSVIPEDGPPSEPLDLLISPSLNLPENSAQLYSNDISFEWSVVDSALKYWFEIAHDALFKELVYSNKGLTDTAFSLSSVKPGVYYWHVASVDSTGFPGEFANYRYINLIEDKTNPYLRVINPAPYSVTKDKQIVLSGETETDASLTVNSVSVKVDNDGTFSQKYNLEDGTNTFRVISKDKAGNKTVFNVKIVYESDPVIELEFSSGNFDKSGNAFITNSAPLVITGITRPGSEITISLSGSTIQRTYADTSGSFLYNIGRNNFEQKLSQTISTPAGYTRIDTIEVKLDNTPPKVVLDELIPRITSQSKILVSGSVEQGCVLYVNSENIEVISGRFSHSVLLNEGSNDIVISAIDKSGNKSTISYYPILDTTPPEFVGHKIIRSITDPSVVKIEVSATDDAGMKKAAKCTVSIDGNPFSKLLLLNEASGKYELQFVLTNPSSTVLLQSVVLEDYLNNSRDYKVK